MKLHLLLTDDIRATMPDSIKIALDWGMLNVRFPHKDYFGLHCCVEGEERDIVDWLKPFDGFVKGNGIPMTETFEIVHISSGSESNNNQPKSYRCEKCKDTGEIHTKNGVYICFH